VKDELRVIESRKLSTNQDYKKINLLPTKFYLQQYQTMIYMTA